MEDYSNKPHEDLLHEIEELKHQISLLRLSDAERKLAIKAQTESEKQYMALLDTIREIVYVIDRDSKLLYISPRVTDVLGYQPEELLGRQFVQYIHQEDLSVLEEKKNNLPAMQETIHQFRVFHKDGSIHHLDTTFRILHSTGQTDIITGIINDITESIISDQSSCEKNIEFSIFENIIEDPIWVLDLDLKYLYVSPSIKKLRGRSVEEVLSTSIDRLFPPEIYNDLVKILQQELEIERKNIPRKFNYRLLELPLIDQDGKKLVMESKVSFLKDNAGNVTAIIGINRDITERKIMEEKLKHSIEEKEILLKEIHHRVKNNFQIITSLLNLQENRIHDPELIGIYRDSQNRIRAMALIHEHLYQSGNLASIDMGEYIHIIAQELFDTYGCSPERISLSIAADPVPLEINQAIPCGLLINEILTNAFKYGFPPEHQDYGSIYIQFSATPAGMVNLVISDNGVGIPEGIDLNNPETLGLQLISMITRNQLRGTMVLDRNNGTTFKISFENRLSPTEENLVF